MKTVTFGSISIRNFKGIHSLDISFKEKITELCGQNAVGKTSVYDAICWLLFDKNSSGESKFEVRELDANGDKVHHTEISVAMKILVDGDPVELTKTQKERWVKKRGESEQQYSGNTNEFMINSFPKSSSEFSKFVSEIVDEEIFKILTNPMTFPQMDWKAQRSLLFSIIGDLDDSGIGNEVEFYDLISGELKVASIDDIRKKWTKSRNDLRKRPDELQTRIDEVNSQIITVDTKPLEAERDSIKAEIAYLNELIQVLNQKNNSDIEIKIRELRSQQKQILQDANASRQRSITDANLALSEAKRIVRDAQYGVDSAKRELDSVKRELEEKESRMSEMLSTYNEAKKVQFPEGKEKCPTCGQKLPEEQIENIRAKWQKEQKQLLANMKDSGNKLAVQVKQLKERLVQNQTQIEQNSKLLTEATAKLESAKEKFNKANQTVEVLPQDIPEHQDIENQISELESQKIDLTEVERQKSELSNQVIEKQNRLANLHAEIKSANDNSVRYARIEELQNELRDVGQKIADCDKVLFAVENYVRAISKRINDRFEGLTFRLFENQINGGMKETCSITIDGVPYESLNSGHRIIAGLNIIRTLQKHYDITVPVIIDNSESLSDNNLPSFDTQMILLKVSNDTSLVVR